MSDSMTNPTAAFHWTDEYLSTIYDALYEKVRHGRSIELEAYFSKNPSVCHMFMLPDQRSEQKLSLLMLAALNGHDAVVRLMIKYHAGDSKWIEQEGVMYDRTGKLTSDVTALWCALEREHYQVARFLIETARADVNHGPSHPMLICGILLKRFDIVYFLVENGYVDVNRTMTNDRWKLNSLMLAIVINDEKAVHYLLCRGAEAGKAMAIGGLTAFDLVIRKNRLNMLELLLTNPYRRISHDQCINLIRTAVRHGRLHMVEFLLEYYPDEKAIEEVELIGSSAIMNLSTPFDRRAAEMLGLLKMTLRKRRSLKRPKSLLPQIAAYDYHRECQTEQELDLIQADEHRLTTEALLIRERILIPRKDRLLVSPIINQIIKLGRTFRVESSLALAFHLASLMQQMSWSYPTQAFVAIFCHMLHLNMPVPLDRFLNVCYAASSILRERNDRDQMQDIVCLIAVAGEMFKKNTMTDSEWHSILQWIRYVCRKRCRTQSGETLIHLSVQSYFIGFDNPCREFIKQVLSVSAARLLICHGRRWIDIDTAEEMNKNTALHLVMEYSRFRDSEAQRIITELLIQAGAHIDPRNDDGDTPYTLSRNDTIRALLLSKESLRSLKCLCARMITDEELPYQQIWPASTPLNQFLTLHASKKRKFFWSEDVGSLSEFDSSEMED